MTLQINLDNRALAAGEIFEVMLDRGLTLLTIRYFNEEILNEMTEGKDILVMQKTKQTVQDLYRESI